VAPALLPLIGGVFRGIFDLGKEVIQDKDKLAEFNYKLAELEGQLNLRLVETQTVPWIDATVKLLFALNSLWRPLGGAVMTGFGIYAHWKGIPLDPVLHGIFDGAFPAWGVSRHVEKSRNGNGAK
jgi:hypothetical protein